MSNFSKSNGVHIAPKSGFFDKITIKNRVNLLIIFVAIITFLTCTLLNFSQIYKTTILCREKEVAAITEVALNLIKEYKVRADNGEFPEKTAKERAIQRINHLKFDGKNYVWINDYNNVFLAHPTKQGQNASNLADKNGLKFISEATKIAMEKGEGSLRYFWPRAGSKISAEKISYIRNFSQWGWVIGTGSYLDDIYMEALKALRVSILINILISIGIALIVMFIANRTLGRSISDPIENITKITRRLAENDLTVEIPEDINKTEIGELNRSFMKFVENLSSLIKQVVDSTQDISASSEEMSASSEQTAQGAQQTASSTTQLAQGAQEISRNVEQGASNLNKMNKTVQDVLEEAKLVSKLGNDAETNANIGAEHIKKAVNKINSIKKVSEDISVNISELGQLSSDIEQIVDLIKNIAGQTNLLALNAAIEAARAGEHGKGFAVVADEVKKLAGQSAGATEKITSMIKEIQHKTQVAVSTMGKTTQEVEEGVFVVNDAGTALETIIIQVKAANVKIQGITKEIDGVAKTSEEMVQMIENISAITEETAASAEEISSITEEQTASMEEISASSQTLAGVAEVLAKQVAVFKI